MRVLWLLMLLSPALLADPVRVVTSVGPLKTFVEAIGGRHVEVISLVQPGYNPHTYDLTPGQVLAVSRADLLVRTGVPFESAWMERIRAANTSMRVIDARHGMELLAAGAHLHEHHDHEHEHEHQEHAGSDTSSETREDIDEVFDPHIWTDPLRVKGLADNILLALLDLAPAYEQAFKTGHAAFVAAIEALHQDIQHDLATVGNRKFLVFHPAWGYFANRYALEQVAIEYQGKQPGAKAMAAVIELARADNIRVIFVQPQFDQRLAKQAAHSIDGQVIVVDPLAADYFTNMRAVAHQFARVLQ